MPELPYVEPLFQYTYDDGSGLPLLPAEEGTWSLEGMAHAATLTTHFMLEGRIKRRAPYSSRFEIFVGPPRSGSWIADFYIALQSAEVWAGVAAGLTVSAPNVVKLLRRLARRATGIQPEHDESEQVEQQHPGTFDALVEAVEPSLIRAHRVIRSDRTSLKVGAGPISFEFDRETKSYIETARRDDDVSLLVGNVASYNVNGRTGRIFFSDLGRTVPFNLARDASPQTEVALGRSLQNYVEHRLANSDLNVRFIAVRAEDGRIKRIIVTSATYNFGLI